MSVSFCGFNENTATFKANEEIAKGTPVKMNGSGTVTACADGEAFCGIAKECSGGYASFVSDGTGVKTADGGREYLVVAVDEAKKTVTFIM